MRDSLITRRGPKTSPRLHERPLSRTAASSDGSRVITSGFDYFSWRAEAGVLALMGGGMGYHLIHDGGAWFWFVFPTAARSGSGG